MPFYCFFKKCKYSKKFWWKILFIFLCSPATSGVNSALFYSYYFKELKKETPCEDYNDSVNYEDDFEVSMNINICRG